MGVGAEVYGNCSSCHGGSRRGRQRGRPLADGEVNEDVPAHRGSVALRVLRHGGVQPRRASPVYGDPNREGGAHDTGSFGVMPARGPTPAATSPTPRFSPSCATSATTSAVSDPRPAVAEEYELWCSRGVADVRRPRRPARRSPTSTPPASAARTAPPRSSTSATPRRGQPRRHPDYPRPGRLPNWAACDPIPELGGMRFGIRAGGRPERTCRTRHRARAGPVPP